MPHKQAGHMKATDRTRPDKMPLPRERPHMNQNYAPLRTLFMGSRPSSNGVMAPDQDMVIKPGLQRRLDDLEIG